MAGFEWAGSLANSAPIKLILPVSETMYVGQMAMWDYGGGAAGTTGGVQILDVANETFENDQPVAGAVVGVYSADRTYNSTYKGDKCTYSATQSDIANTGPGLVEIVLAIPNVTLFKGPIYDAVFGTALTELVVTSADSGGTTVTHANDTITDCHDDLSTVYCRSGANRGLYRTNTTAGTNEQVVTVPFPNGIALGDVFVSASVNLGMSGLDVVATANFIDGDNDLDVYYNVVFHEINLEESGREYGVFSFSASACESAA